MTHIDVKKSVADAVKKHTILAAYCTLDCYGVPATVEPTLRTDLAALNQLDRCPLVDAATALVTVALEHAVEPTTATYDKARSARDVLGNLMINTREIKG